MVDITFRPENIAIPGDDQYARFTMAIFHKTDRIGQVEIAVVRARGFGEWLPAAYIQMQMLGQSIHDHAELLLKHQATSPPP